jgi:UDPglucose--hexose-1-phosphate uridylyltransferase
MSVDHIEKIITLWVERTAAQSQRDDVACVFVFENRGAELGATIEHPHGQIYAFDHMPIRSSERLTWKPPSQADLVVTRNDHWSCAVPPASAYPVALEMWPTSRISDLMSLSVEQRRDLARMLHDIMKRLDELFSSPLPYMLWINQRDFSSTTESTHWLHIEIVSPWRGKNLMRYIAAAEVGTGEYFNPMTPESLAAQLAGHAE